MASERENFGLTGPSFLTNVDWNNSNHRRSVAASLVQGVYVLERDRQESRQGPQALAPPWWEFFNFKLNQVLVDDHDLSYFGAIYELNFPYPYPYPNYAGQGPPQYVIAFRGTINKSGTRGEDFKINLNCMINNLQDSRRFHIGMEKAQDIVSHAGPTTGNVWLAGHSIGSSLALIIGRHLAKNTGSYIETYLFNPPFSSPPIEKIKNEKVKLGLRLAGSVLTAGLAMATASKSQENHDPFVVLASWVPYLFINQSDLICSEYIGYFEHREKMESIGIGKIGRLATKHSIGSIVSSARGKDSEAIHLIPSAYLSINSGPSQTFKENHGIHQWWKPDLEAKYKLYQYK